MTERPPLPAGLRDAGAELWAEILSDLEPGWELDSRELHLLKRACRCADELVDLEAAIDRNGVIVTGSRNQTVIHPGVVGALGDAAASAGTSERRVDQIVASLLEARAARARGDRRTA